MEQSAILVSRRLKSFVDERHDGNVSQACFYLDLSNDYNSVYRLYHGKMNSVHFFLAYKILKQTDPASYRAILADLYPEEMGCVAQIGGESTEDAVGMMAKKFALAVSSKTHFSIYSRALEHRGLKPDDIATEFGQHGLQVADELINAGVIFLEGGILRSKFADLDIRPSIPSVKQHAHLHIDLVRDAAPGFRMENPFACLNDDGIRGAWTILDKASTDILTLFRNPKFQGNKMYLATILGGQMSMPSDKENGQ